MCIDLVNGRSWLQPLNTTAKCGTILLCHISPFRISHLTNPPPPRSCPPKKKGGQAIGAHRRTHTHTAPTTPGTETTHAHKYTHIIAAWGTGGHDGIVAWGEWEPQVCGDRVGRGAGGEADNVMTN